MSRDDEASRIERVYAGYAGDARVRRRWSSENRGNVRIEEERDAAVRILLGRAGLWPPVGFNVLDVGCGTGRLLRWLIENGAGGEDVVGVDLLADRLAAAHSELLLARADGAHLPFGAAAFRLVCVFTVFSSILEDEIAADVASEIDRVLERGGKLLWYDFRVGNPLNPNTRGIGRRRIEALFPGYDLRLRSITLLPQLARRLGPLTGPIYPVLSRVPLARTHYLGVLTSP